ncbi:MAG: ModE family transcriptional regulator [Arcobacteraceae bacterium]
MARLQKHIKLDNTQKQYILENLDSDGRLSCLKSFKVARLIGLEPLEMSDACKSIGIKISNCELGVFGKLEFGEASNDLYKDIAQNFKNNTDVECKTIWKSAEKSTLKKVGATVKNSDIEVTHCQLGCFFHERKEKRVDKA